MPVLTLPPAHAALLRDVAALLRAHGARGWLVGGALRDLLLGQPGDDLDLAVDGPALELARRFADATGGAWVLLDEPTQAARVVWARSPQDAAAPVQLDLVRLRAPTIEADLRLRDFTINALALPLEALPTTPDSAPITIAPAQVLDPTGGLEDLLQRRVLRMTGAQAFGDDPLRTLRAIRLAAQLDLSIEPATRAALEAHAPQIARVAQERVRDELLKLLRLPHVAPWLALMDQLGLLTAIIPELEPARGCAQPSQHVLPVFEHLLEAVAAWEWIADQLAGTSPSMSDAAVPLVLPAAVRAHPDLRLSLPDGAALLARMREPLVAGAERGAIFKLAVLLHDVGKPATKAVRAGRITFYEHQRVGAELAAGVAQRLRLGREAGTYLTLIVREHMRPGQLRALGPALTRRAIYRLLRDLGAAFPDLLLHSLADHLAARGHFLSRADWEQHVAWTAALLREDWQQHARSARPDRLVSGHDLITVLGIAPGPQIGRLLELIEEARFAGEVRTRDEALALAQRLRESAGGGGAPPQLPQRER
ncbi:CCA tRNA nucleotidyltransferase [Kallotenue papyrolyticum]|uniref:CCA tRNA nucleotidyltransferase n=1 Tax=Kallotenue papyrolyticum TaxID=1325125 RepID=UPI000492E418|nr:CCA tRNA nucleotidyltransferase [Kallotenue papyrolyticum]